MNTLVAMVGAIDGVFSILAAIIVLVKPVREHVFGTRSVREGQKCLLRADMLRTYYNNNERNTIRQYEYENFVMEYKAYKALGGNSFIDKVYADVSGWEILT